MYVSAYMCGYTCKYLHISICLSNFITTEVDQRKPEMIQRVLS